MSEPQRAEITSSAMRLVHVASRALLLLLIGASPALAQVAATPADPDNYPNRTIRYVVPYPPGAFNDTLGRIFAQKLQEAWGVPVVVENRPGGGTLIGTDSVAKAAPDGYTLLGVAFPFGSNPSIYKSLPYDTVKDFTPLILAGQTQNLLVVRPSMPIKSVQEFIDYARNNPGKVSYGSTGIGSSNHLSMELFKSMTGIDIVHVPYKGSAPMVNDLLGDHIDVCARRSRNASEEKLIKGVAPCFASTSLISGVFNISATSTLIFWAMAGFNPAGARIPHQASTSNFSKPPASAMVGISGAAATRLALLTANARTTLL